MESERKHDDGEIEKPDTKPRAEELPLSSRQEPASLGDKAKDEARKPNHLLGEFWKSIQGCAIVVTAVSTAAYACVSWYQWRAIQDANASNRQTVEESNRRTDESLKITRETLVAAQESNRLAAENVREMERSFKKRDRPWMAVETITSKPPDEGKWTVEIKLRNVGSMPAQNLQTIGRLSWILPPLTERSDLPPDELTPMSDVPSTIVLGTGLTSACTLGHDFSKEEAEKFKSRKLLLIVHGTSTYWEPLGGRHRLEFCAQWSARGEWTLCPSRNKSE